MLTKPQGVGGHIQGIRYLSAQWRECTKGKFQDTTCDSNYTYKRKPKMWRTDILLAAPKVSLCKNDCDWLLIFATPSGIQKTSTRVEPKVPTCKVQPFELSL